VLLLDILCVLVIRGQGFGCLYVSLLGVCVCVCVCVGVLLVALVSEICGVFGLWV